MKTWFLSQFSCIWVQILYLALEGRNCSRSCARVVMSDRTSGAVPLLLLMNEVQHYFFSLWFYFYFCPSAHRPGFLSSGKIPWEHCNHSAVVVRRGLVLKRVYWVTLYSSGWRNLDILSHEMDDGNWEEIGWNTPTKTKPKKMKLKSVFCVLWGQGVCMAARGISHLSTLEDI